MCKFTNPLFVLILLGLSSIEGSLLPEARNEANNLLFDLLANDNDYDLHYDQRQKGSENYRLKLDSFFIGLPSEQTSDILLLTDDFMDSLGVDSKSRAGATQATENALKSEKDKQNESALRLPKPDEVVVEVLPAKKEAEPRQERLEKKIVADKSTAPR